MKHDSLEPQTVFDVIDGRVERLFLPNPHSLVLDGIEWGYAEAMFTPAFWAAQAWHDRNTNRYGDFAWSSDLREEIVACLLGGHGVTSEMNRVAYERLKTSGVLAPDAQRVSEEAIFQLLQTPFSINGRAVRYRFPHRKSIFVAAALKKLNCSGTPPNRAKELRTWLLEFPGIGLKIASWITRNHLRTGDVAVIDIHIFRAGVIMGLFSDRDAISRDYLPMEEKFIRFAQSIGVCAEKLDVIIWRIMKDSRNLGIRIYQNAA